MGSGDRIARSGSGEGEGGSACTGRGIVMHGVTESLVTALVDWFSAGYPGRLATPPPAGVGADRDVAIPSCNRKTIFTDHRKVWRTFLCDAMGAGLSIAA